MLPKTVKCPLCERFYQRGNLTKSYQVRCPYCGFKSHIWEVELYVSHNGTYKKAPTKYRRALKHLKQKYLNKYR